MWILVIWRAKHLSATYDEVWVETIAKDSIRDIMFHPRNFTSANNHILNTLLAKLSLWIHDAALFSARLPNVISFLIYFAGIKYMARNLSNNVWLRWSLITSLCSMPFVLDFFSLSRGYGLALSFQALSMAFAYGYLHTLKKIFQWGAYLSAFITVWANFTWINFYLALWLSLILCKWYTDRTDFRNIVSLLKQAVIPLGIFAGMCLLFYKPILMLRGNDEFRWGSNAWIDSYHKIAAALNYNTTFFLSVLTQIFLFLLVAYIIFRLVKKVKHHDPNLELILFSVWIIGFLIFISIAQRFLLQSMYPDGRKALMYYIFVPILLINALQLSGHLSASRLRVYSTLMIIGFGIHLGLNIDVMSVKEWRSDKYNAEVADMILSAEGRGMKVSWELGSSMDYYARKKNKLKPVHTIDENTPEAMYYYVSEMDVDKIPGRSMYIKRFDNGYTLWRKD